MMLQAPATSNTNTTGDLFVVTAETATLNMVGNKGSLLLEGVRPHTIWFADKPARTGGQLATSEFFGNEFVQDGAHTNQTLFLLLGPQGWARAALGPFQENLLRTKFAA